MEAFYSGILRCLLALVLMPFCDTSWAADKRLPTQLVTIPFMARESPHRLYADQLLALALTLSRDKFGPFRIEQQTQESVIKRQLIELQRGGGLSVAVAMPTADWMEGALPVRIPIMKGLSSYRLFLGHGSKQTLFDAVKTVDDLKQITIGQGPGWSTAKILEDNGFKIVYGGAYPTLMPMLKANRFQVLMRGVFEVEPELLANKANNPDLVLVENFAVFTYMPMYYFVAKDQPLLAERLDYGLRKAHANGQLDSLFKHYFSDSLRLLKNKQRKIFHVPNTNIDPSFFERDRPYLLPAIVALEKDLKP